LDVFGSEENEDVDEDINPTEVLKKNLESPYMFFFISNDEISLGHA